MRVNNSLLCSIKGFSISQLKVLYLIVYKYNLIHKYGKENEKSNSLWLDYYDTSRLFELKKISKQNIISIVEDMNNRVIIPEYNQDIARSARLFDRIIFTRDTDEFYFKFNDKNIDLIINIDINFSEIILENLLKLNKKYSGKLYELYCRFKNQKLYKMPLAKLLYFFDVPQNYSSSEMERAVLNTSIKEIKDKLGINVSYTKEKKHGMITHYIFKFN